jgi:hypothetical protein
MRILKSLALGLRFQADYHQVTKSPQLFHHQVRDGLVWVQLSLEHQGLSLKSLKSLNLVYSNWFFFHNSVLRTTM